MSQPQHSPPPAETAATTAEADGAHAPLMDPAEAKMIEKGMALTVSDCHQRRRGGITALHKHRRGHHIPARVQAGQGPCHMSVTVCGWGKLHSCGLMIERGVALWL